jgi:hypothetical protein
MAKLTKQQFANWLGYDVNKVFETIELVKLADPDGIWAHAQDMGDEDMENIVEAIYFEYGSLKEAIEACKDALGISEMNEADGNMQGQLTFNELPQKVKDNFFRNVTISVAFVKKDGTVRHMAFRRNLKSYVRSDAPKTDAQINVLKNNNLLNVYDTNVFIQKKRELGSDDLAAKQSYRNISLGNVLAFLTGGELFDMRERNQIKERFGEDIYRSLTKGMEAAMRSDEQTSEAGMQQNESLLPEGEKQKIKETILRIKGLSKQMDDFSDMMDVIDSNPQYLDKYKKIITQALRDVMSGGKLTAYKMMLQEVFFSNSQFIIEVLKHRGSLANAPMIEGMLDRVGSAMSTLLLKGSIDETIESPTSMYKYIDDPAVKEELKRMSVERGKNKLMGMIDASKLK